MWVVTDLCVADNNHAELSVNVGEVTIPIPTYVQPNVYPLNSQETVAHEVEVSGL